MKHADIHPGSSYVVSYKGRNLTAKAIGTQPAGWLVEILKDDAKVLAVVKASRFLRRSEPNE